MARSKSIAQINRQLARIKAATGGTGSRYQRAAQAASAYRKNISGTKSFQNSFGKNIGNATNRQYSANTYMGRNGG